jgi:transcriptional regulator with XRE-family HTH domain
MTIGERIKEHRFKLNKTRKQMAKELGISVKTLWGWETDRWQPTGLLKKRIGNGYALWFIDFIKLCQHDAK